jgi:predicted MFS family arabinose efflux permease
VVITDSTANSQITPRRYGAAMRRSNVPLLLAIVVEAMGYGAIFGLLADLQDTFHFEQNGLGVIAASAFPAALVGQLGLSRYADRGYTRKLLWFGLATASAGMVWFWLGDSLWEFVFARVLVGLGSGTFIPAARRVILSHDPHNPGRAISMAGAADIGGFLVGIPVAKGLEHLFDSPNTPFLALAIGLLVVGPLATMTPEPPPHESHVGGDEVRKVFAVPLARAGIIIGLGFAAIIGTFDAIASRFLKDLGGTDAELIIVMIALFVPLVIAMPFAGKLVDHVGPARAGAVALVVAAPIVFSFGMTRELVAIGILGGVVALAYSVVYTSGQAAVAGGTVPLGLSGAGQGAYEATYAVGSMICAFLAPRLYDRHDAMPLWAAVAAASLVAAAATWWTAGSSRDEVVHMAQLEEEMYGTGA